MKTLLTLALMLACGASSFATDTSPPVITTQPADTTVGVGQTAYFSVYAAGAAPISFQWSMNGVPISVSGTAQTYFAFASDSTNGDIFSVVVTNPFGSAVSRNAVLTIDQALFPAAIVTEVASQTVVQHHTATFSVTAIGNPPPTYRWIRDGNWIPGATASTYTTPPTRMSDSGSVFGVEVRNSGTPYGINSYGAVLTVTSH